MIRVSVVATGIDKAASEIVGRPAIAGSVRPPTSRTAHARRPSRSVRRRSFSDPVDPVAEAIRAAEIQAAAMVEPRQSAAAAGFPPAEQAVPRRSARAAPGAAAALSPAAAAAGSRQPRSSRRRRSRACRGSRTSRPRSRPRSKAARRAPRAARRTRSDGPAEASHHRPVPARRRTRAPAAGAAQASRKLRQQPDPRRLPSQDPQRLCAPPGRARRAWPRRPAAGPAGGRSARDPGFPAPPSQLSWGIAAIDRAGGLRLPEAILLFETNRLSLPAYGLAEVMQRKKAVIWPVRRLRLCSARCK